MSYYDNVINLKKSYSHFWYVLQLFKISYQNTENIIYEFKKLYNFHLSYLS